MYNLDGNSEASLKGVKYLKRSGYLNKLVKQGY